MKIENTPENKAKFFALYWGQEVLTRPYVGGKKWILGEEVSVLSAMSKHGYDYKYFLELTPLSQITEEDASNLDYSSAQAARITLETVPHDFAEDMDYLRSKGYATNWMSTSVETFIEWGWVKLKEE